MLTDGKVIWNIVLDLDAVKRDISRVGTGRDEAYKPEAGTPPRTRSGKCVMKCHAPTERARSSDKDPRGRAG
jgi:hypothetical protein